MKPALSLSPLADDAQLVAACLRGDDSAWPSLLDKYGHAIYSIPLQRGLSRWEAAGVFQTVCLLLANDLPSLRDASALPRWIVETTSRECTPLGLGPAMDAWCVQLLQDWGPRVSALREDASYEPPADAVSAAVTYFAAERMAADGIASRGGLTVIPALVFDTMLTVAGGSERSDGSDWRHLVYQAAPLSIDLQLQRGRVDRLFITGKIRDTREARQLSTSAVAAVIAGDTHITAARCNSFGEFFLEFGADADLMLQIEANGVWAYIPLDRWPAARFAN